MLLYLTFISAIQFGQIADANIITPSKRELEMLDEVNLARTNPTTYVTYIKSYTDYWESDKEELEAAAELETEMLAMQPLKPLTWAPNLYQDAIRHGRWMKQTNKFAHSNYEWAENLVAGDEKIRFAVLNLLIDAGIASRGHRKNIFNTGYTEFACFEVAGTVDESDFVFIQEFN